MTSQTGTGVGGSVWMMSRTMRIACASFSARWSTTPETLGVQLAAAEFLGRDDLADGGLHQRRAAQEDGALVADDHRLVAHRRDVGAARRAGAEHRGDLRDLARGQVGLVVEDAPEVLAVREHLVLHGQEGAARVDEVDAGQAVFEGDFLGAQVLLDRHREVGAALDRGVVAHDHDVPAVDHADSGDHPGPGGVAAVHVLRRKRCNLEERRPLVQQGLDAVARQQLAAVHVALPRFLRTALCRRGQTLTQLGNQILLLGCVLEKAGIRGIDAAGQSLHISSFLASVGEG